MKYKCANSNCGTVVELEKRPLKFICPECGVLNTPQSGNEGADQACGCLLPESFEWLLPSGKIEDPRGDRFDKFLTADDGTVIPRLDWISTYGYDPEIVWRKMRSQGKNGVEGYLNLSSLKNKK